MPVGRTRKGKMQANSLPIVVRSTRSIVISDEEGNTSQCNQPSTALEINPDNLNSNTNQTLTVIERSQCNSDQTQIDSVQIHALNQNVNCLDKRNEEDLTCK